MSDLNANIEQGREALETGEFSKAIDLLRKAIKLDDTSVEAHLLLGEAMSERGDNSGAIA